MPDAAREGSASRSVRQGRATIAKPLFPFPPDYRIKKRSEFCRIQERGRKLYSKHFLLALLDSQQPYCRVGITVSAKVDKRAVYRNRLKRRIRELFRLNRTRFKGNFDIVVIARKDACLCSLEQIRREVLGALYHHDLLD